MESQFIQKTCIKCNIKKCITSFKTDKRGTRNVCNGCRNYHLNLAAKGRRQFLKEGKKIPLLCDCCGKEKHNLVFDHNHQTEKFRGWICQSCNQGLGLLGDDILSLEKAIMYLKKSELS